MMQKLSSSTGIIAWQTAEKKGTPLNPCFFQYQGKIISHSGKTYSEGKPGDVGFCTVAARQAAKEKGVFRD